MTPTIDQLADGILRLGYDDRQPCSELPFDVWRELQERGYFEHRRKGQPRLTKQGEKSFASIRDGTRSRIDPLS
jgi:hypothetical protein